MNTEQTIERLKEWQTEIARAADGSAMWGSVYFESLNADIASAITLLQNKEKDTERLDCLEDHSMDLVEGGGLWACCSCSSDDAQDWQWQNSPREAIDTAIAAQQEAESV